MLAQRVASAAAGLPLVILLIWAGGPWYTGAAALIVLIAAYEFQAPQQGAWAPLAIIAAGLAAAVPAEPGAHVFEPGAGVGAAAEIDAADDIAPLVRAPHLQPAAVKPGQFDEVVGLQHHVVEFEEAQRLFALQATLDAVEA